MLVSASASPPSIPSLNAVAMSRRRCCLAAVYPMAAVLLALLVLDYHTPFWHGTSMETEAPTTDNQTYESKVSKAVSTRTPSDRIRLANNTFVLHVGPPKTGTSTIQHAMKQPPIKALLKKDKYVLVGEQQGKMKIPKVTLARKNSETSYSFDSKFQRMLQEKERIGNHVFGSNEGFSHVTEEECQGWNQLKDAWNIRVVLTYRRLHSYIPSQWNQHYKFLRSKTKMTHTGHGSRLHRGHFDWPGVKGDYEIPSIEDWIKSKFVGPGKRKHPARKAWQVWHACIDGDKGSSSSSSITLINMHDNSQYHGDFLTHFACQALPGANSLCAALFNDTVPIPENTNESVNLDYDMLATHAHQAGMVHERHARFNVTNAIQAYAAEEELVFPKSCPDDTSLEWLYEWSLESEMWAMQVMDSSSSDESSSHYWKPLNPSQQAQFDADWNRTLPKLCTVDAKATLEQDVWKDFFHRHFAE